MAIISVTERTQEKGFDRPTGEIRYTRGFQVISDDPTDSAEDVRTAAGIPDIGDTFPDNAGAFVNSVKAKMLKPDQDRVNWLVTVTYSTIVTSITPWTDPLDEPPTYVYSFERRTFAPDVDETGAPVSNPVGDPFDPGVTIDFHMLKIRVTRNLAAYDPLSARTFLDTVNDAIFTIDTTAYAAFTLRMLDFSATSVADYFRVTWEMLYDPTGAPVGPGLHNIDVLNAGFNYYEVAATTPKIRAMNEGQPTPNPVLLEADGTLVADGDDPSFSTFEFYPEEDWSSLDMTP